MPGEYLSLLLFVGIVLAFGLGILGLSWALGPKKRTPRKFTPYECGVPLLESSRHRFSVKFYLVATLFILFDIETVFLLPWALVYREMPDPTFVFLEMAVFIAVLAAGFVYLWKKGALEWD